MAAHRLCDLPVLGHDLTTVELRQTWTLASVRRRGKNTNLSSKSNPLCCRWKNYDTSKWRWRRPRKKYKVDELSIKILAIYLQQ